jgi:hypothetical protein
MRALQQTSLNGPQDLRLITDAPVPVPGPGEIRIRVTAAGLNFGDISQARGTFPGGPQPPYLAGFEAAEALARGAKRVYAGTRQPLAHPDDRVTPLSLDVTSTALPAVPPFGAGPLAAAQAQGTGDLRSTSSRGRPRPSSAQAVLAPPAPECHGCCRLGQHGAGR